MVETSKDKGICSSERTSHKKGLPLANVKVYPCIQSDFSRKYRTRLVSDDDITWRLRERMIYWMYHLNSLPDKAGLESAN